jgi:hypothetical protein
MARMNDVDLVKLGADFSERAYIAKFHQFLS